MEFIYFNDTSCLAFPVNLIALLFLLLGIWTLHRYYATIPVVRWLKSIPCTLGTSSFLIILLIIEGIWALQLFRTWIFISALLVLIVILGLITLSKVEDFSRRNILFLLNHGGLWLALIAALFGAPDHEEYKCIASLNQPEYTAISPKGHLQPLPFTIRLDKFELEYYPQSSGVRIPKRFTSTVTLKSKDKEIRKQIEVNHPVRFKGYSIYQDGYDPSRGADSTYSIFLIVRDPWIGMVYAGIILMLAGAAGLIIYGPIKKQKYDMG